VAWTGGATTSRDQSSPHSGIAAALIDAPAENDVRLVQSVAVQPNTRYRFSGYIRTDNVQLGLGANLSIEWSGTQWATSNSVFGTTDWTFVSFEVDTGPATSFQAQARLGHYAATSQGRAWFDDLRLEMLAN
jgi:hypothetical protein